MKKIMFGFSNDPDPKGSQEGIGINPGLHLLEANYYGAIGYERDSYIVAKVTEDEYGRYPHLLGNFIVRPAIADMYVDGSGVIFLDQEESVISKQIEERLNSLDVRDKISTINDIKACCNGTYDADRSFKFLTLDDTFYACSITHEAFERKNDALKSCHSSFSQLQEQLLSIRNDYSR